MNLAGSLPYETHYATCNRGSKQFQHLQNFIAQGIIRYLATCSSNTMYPILSSAADILSDGIKFKAQAYSDSEVLFRGEEYKIHVITAPDAGILQFQITTIKIIGPDLSG